MKGSERARRNRYRGLRGLVRHVLWRDGRSDTKPPPEGPVDRPPASGIAYAAVYGTCIWCGLPAVSRATGFDLKWHGDCVPYYELAAGHHRGTLTKREPDDACICGDPDPTELDHVLAIGVAQRLAESLGRKVYALAFLPENLQWLCHECHVEKTKIDRAWMRQLDNPAVDEPFIQMRFAL